MRSEDELNRLIERFIGDQLGKLWDFIEIEEREITNGLLHDYLDVNF